jgi:folate-binding protein YgfZ
MARAALLPDRAVLEISGEDREHFLQGLVTNDVAGLQEGEARFAGLLNPQGKILFDFFIVRRGASFLLDCPASMAGDLVKRLSLYKLRAMVAIADVSARLRVAAAWGDGAAEWEGNLPSPQPSPSGRGSPAAAVAASFPLPGGEGQGEGLRHIAYPDPRLSALGFRLLLDADSAPNFPAQPEDYEAMRVGLAVPEGGKDYAYGDAFPHEAGFDLLHGVSFKKGCFVGQEVVSRMQHRGTARSRVLAAMAREPLPKGGVDILADGVPVGRLGSVAGQSGVALARIDRVGQALAKGESFTAGGVPVKLSVPAWASYSLRPEPAESGR